MSSWIFTATGLFAAGFGVGLYRDRPGARGNLRGWAWALLVPAGFVFGTYLLANLFNSDALGWVFGLSLMVGLALLPLVALFALGMKLGARLKPQPAAAASDTVAAAAAVLINLDRDSVHASDDGASQTPGFTVEAGTPLAQAVKQLQACGYLPQISGGQATWIIESSARPGQPLGVCAQQWTAPQLLVPLDETVGQHFGAATAALRFRYWCQVDPAWVFWRLQSGQSLPPRY